MDVLALFTDGTAEKIIIDSFPSKENEKGLVIRTTINSYDLKESAVSSVRNTYTILGKYFKDLPDVITVCIYGFSNKVLGSSADMAFALAFVGHLIEKGILTVNNPVPEVVAATGMIDERLGIRSVKGLREKILAAIEKKAGIIYFPQENIKDFEELKEKDTEFNKIVKEKNIVPIKSLEELFDKLGIIHEIQTLNTTQKPALHKIPLILSVVLCLIIISAIYIAFSTNTPNNDKSNVVLMLTDSTPSVPHKGESTLLPVINTPTAVSTAVKVTTETSRPTSTPLSTSTPGVKATVAMANTSAPKAAVSHIPEVSNFAGNSLANIANGGFASIQGEWIYYYSNLDVGLYKIRNDGQSSATVLSNNYASCINVNGNYIYYINKADNKLYKVKTDGSNTRKLNNDSVGTVYVVGDWIYYICLDDNRIYRIDKNGLDRTPLCNNLSNDLGLTDSKFILRNMNIYHNLIYFYAQFSMDNKKNGLYKMKLDGSNITCISNDICDALEIDNGYVYFISSNDGYMYIMDLNGQDKVKVCSDSIMSFNINSSWIYYSNYKGLYKMSTGSDFSIKLTEDYTDKINIAGNWIYYFNANDGNKLYRIRTNGSDKQLVEQNR